MRLKLTLLSIPLLLLIAVPMAQAQMMEGAQPRGERAEQYGERQELMEERQANMEERQAERDEMRDERCQTITTRIEERLAKYDELKQQRVQNYQNMADRLDILVERLASSEIDTSGLQAEIDQMKEMTAELSANAQQATETLRMSQQYACGESEGQFAGQLEQARQEFRLVYESAQALRDHYMNELRPALLALREQAKQQADQGGM